MNFSLLLPTRARPERLRTFLDSVFQTALTPDKIEIVLFIDDDDISMMDFEHPVPNIKKIIEKRNTMGFYNTACFDASHGKIIIAVNDDVVVKTSHWDEKILSFDRSQRSPIYLAYPNDMNKKSKLPTFPILTRETCETLNAIFPLVYKGSFLDLHLLDIFMRLKKYGLNRIFYLEDIIFEHFHIRNKKARSDSTYSQRGRFFDDPVFVSLSRLRRQEAITLIRSRFLYNRILSDDTGRVSENRGDRLDLVSSDTMRCAERDRATKRSLLGGVVSYFCCFVLDTSLSWRWRVYLFVYFSARLVFSKFFDSMPQTA